MIKHGYNAGKEDNMSSLTRSLESLDQALDSLEKAFDQRLTQFATKQKDLTHQLHDAHKESSHVAKGLDDAIEKIETIVGAKG